MKIHIGDAVSLSRATNFKLKPDDRQSIIETDQGNIIQDYGHVESGDKMSFLAVFHKSEFLKVWGYFHKRELVTFIDQSGVTWHGMRVCVISYGYNDRFPEYIDCELELWRI